MYHQYIPNNKRSEHLSSEHETESSLPILEQIGKMKQKGKLPWLQRAGRPDRKKKKLSFPFCMNSPIYLTT
jgi:hypothetical protein